MLVVVLITSILVLGALIVALVTAVSWRRELTRASVAIHRLDVGAGPSDDPGADRRRDPHR